MTRAKPKTAPRHKDFGWPTNLEEMEPLTFTLYDQEFTCYKQIHGVALLRFVKEAGSNDDARAVEAILELFERVMNKEEYKRFQKLCDDPDTVVPVDTLVEIIGWLVEVYSERPTKSS